MKTFGVVLLAAMGGYLAELFGGMSLIEAFFSNIHDKSMEAPMTCAFVFRPLVAIVVVIMTVVFRSRRSIKG